MPETGHASIVTAGETDRPVGVGTDDRGSRRLSRSASYRADIFYATILILPLSAESVRLDDENTTDKVE